MKQLDALLTKMQGLESSDLHIKCGKRPRYRIDGLLKLLVEFLKTHYALVGESRSPVIHERRRTPGMTARVRSRFAVSGKHLVRWTA